MTMNFPILGLIALVLFGCTNNDKNTNHTNAGENSFNSISILLCGHGRSIYAGEIPKDSIIPKEFLQDIFLIEIGKNGKIITTHGFGEFTSNNSDGRIDLKMNQIEKIEDSTLSGDDIKTLNSLASTIIKKEEYWSNLDLTDSWFIKLKIDNKTNVFYSGEGLLTDFDKVSPEYMTLVDILVELSPIEIEDYR